MKIKKIKAEDRELFNDFMSTGPKSHVLQSYEWGELKELTDWKPIRLLVKDGEKIRAGISILKRPGPMGTSIYYAPRGPVADFNDTEALDFLLKDIKARARKDGAILLKIDPDIPISEKEPVEKYLKTRGFKSTTKDLNFEGVQPRFVFRLPLEKPLDEIMMSFHRKTRYNIRLAGRRGVEIRDNCTREDLKKFYEILLVTSERDEFLVRDYIYYEQIWDKLIEKGIAKLFMAEYKGKPIAGTIAFIFGKKAWYIYGASSNKHRNVMPNYAIQWAMIEWAKENDCIMYDFRGVSGDLSPDNPLYGLYRFKKGFNGEFTEFIGEYDLPFSKPLYILWDKGVPLFRTVRRSIVNLTRKFK
ncbi:MAG TPA: peptidoglycan bridge formation glycyltransferase FemA/FemB family protein [Thermoanaerobacterales bacterium]|nr:peptidoglycan bridge formation glycyltransferase FemA/FemB family protein [Thermoanaerobacterales bacterium]